VVDVALVPRNELGENLTRESKADLGIGASLDTKGEGYGERGIRWADKETSWGSSMGCSRPLTTEAGPCWSQGGHKIADIGEGLEERSRIFQAIEVYEIHQVDSQRDQGESGPVTAVQHNAQNPTGASTNLLFLQFNTMCKPPASRTQDPNAQIETPPQA
jgi:hypothetical protein